MVVEVSLPIFYRANKWNTFTTHLLNFFPILSRSLKSVIHYSLIWMYRTVQSRSLLLIFLLFNCCARCLSGHQVVYLVFHSNRRRKRRKELISFNVTNEMVRMLEPWMIKCLQIHGIITFLKFSEMNHSTRIWEYLMLTFGALWGEFTCSIVLYLPNSILRVIHVSIQRKYIFANVFQQWMNPAKSIDEISF